MTEITDQMVAKIRAAEDKLAQSWVHLKKTTKGATSQKKNPDGTFVSETSEWGMAENDYEAARKDLDDAIALANPPTPSILDNIFVTRLATGTVAAGGDLTRYGCVALNAGDYVKAKELRAAGVITLVYKCMSSTRSWDDPVNTSGGIAYTSALPEWFATKNGQRIEWAGQDPGHWQMDIASSTYRAEWIKQVLTNLDAHPDSWDGVIVDNANIDPSGYSSFPWDRYADWTVYRDATRSFLAGVGPVIQATGRLFVPNIQHHGTKLTETLWRDWIQFTSGGHLEHYTKWGDGTDGHILDNGWDWSGQAFLRASQEMNKLFLGTFACPITDTRSMNYARGSFLIDWDGKGNSALGYEPNPLAQDPYSPVWTKDIGLPLGPKVATLTGYTRSYERGTVTVDKTNGTAVIG